MARFGTQTYIVAAASLLTSRIADACVLTDGTTYRQWFLLDMLSRMGTGAHTLSELADFSGTTRQNTKRLVQALASRGLCELRRGRSDARRREVRLTPAGRTWLQEMEPRIVAASEKVFCELSDAELDQLAHSLQKILDHGVDDS